MLTDPFSSSKITAYLAVIYRDLHIQVWITFEKKNVYVARFPFS